MSMAMQLAAAGWWGGDPEKIMQAPADVVMAAMQFVGFKSDYEAAYIEMNKGKA